MNNNYEFEWYIFKNANETTPVAAFNDNELALNFMNTLNDGAIKINKIWLNKKK